MNTTANVNKLKHPPNEATNEKEESLFKSQESRKNLLPKGSKIEHSH